MYIQYIKSKEKIDFLKETYFGVIEM